MLRVEQLAVACAIDALHGISLRGRPGRVVALLAPAAPETNAC
jgi:hypothetical protein